MQRFRGIKGFLFLIVFFPLVLMGSACTTFTDIQSSTYKNDILYASDTLRGWVTCKNGAFTPSNNTTRREAIAMALLAGGHTPPNSTAECFDDIENETWARDYICYAKTQGIITANASFRPDDNVSFQEASAMILRSMTSDSYTVSNDPNTWSNAYLEKMSYYGFMDDKLSKVKRDYFTHLLRAIDADPYKQAQVAEPRISSASLSTSNINQGDEVTLTVQLTNPMISGFSIDAQSLNTSIPSLNCSGTSCAVTFIANNVGARLLVVYLKKNAQNIDTERVDFDVQEAIVIPTPTISSVTPRTANLNEKTTFTVNGENLTSTLVLYIPDCDNMTSLGGTTSRKQFSCTPINYIGSKASVVKDKPSGTTLKSISINIIKIPDPIVYPKITIMTLANSTIQIGDKLSVTLKLDKALESGQKIVVEYESKELDVSCSSLDCSVYPTMNKVGDTQSIRAVLVNKDGNKISASSQTKTYTVKEIDKTALSIISTDISPKISAKNVEHNITLSLSSKLINGQVLRFELEGLTRGTFFEPKNSPMTCFNLKCASQNSVKYAGVDRAIRFAIFEGTTQITEWKVDTYTVTEPTIKNVIAKPQTAMQGTYFGFDAILSEPLPLNHSVKAQLETGEDDVYLDLKYATCEDTSCHYGKIIGTAKYNRKVRFGIFYDDKLTSSGWKYATYNVDADSSINEAPIHINSYPTSEGSNVIPLAKNFKFYTNWSDKENDKVVDVKVRYKKVGSSDWSNEIVLDHYKGTSFTNNKEALKIDEEGSYEFEVKASDKVDLNAPIIHTTTWISAGTFEVKKIVKPMLLADVSNITINSGESASFDLKVIDYNDDIDRVVLSWYYGDKNPEIFRNLKSGDTITPSHKVWTNRTATATAYDKAGNKSVPIKVTITTAQHNQNFFINQPKVAKTYGKNTGSCANRAVNTATGAEMFSFSFLNQQGLNALSFNVSYSSLLLTRTEMGRGWSTNFGFTARIQEKINGDLIVYWNDKNYNFFQKDDSNSSLFTSIDKPTKYDKLIKNADKSYTLTKKNRIIYQFDEYGVLESIENHKEQKLGFIFDVNSSLSRVTDIASGLFIEYHYKDNKLIKVSDSIDREIVLTYSDDNLSNLIHIDAPEGMGYDFEYNSLGQVTKYSYSDGTVYFENTYLANGLVNTEDDGVDTNTLVKYTFDHNSTAGKILSEYNDRNGDISKYVYDTNTYSLLSKIDKLNNRIDNVYDAKSQLISSTNAKNQTVNLEYNINGDVSKKISPDGSYEELKYDEHKNLISHSLVSSDGSQKFTTTYEYDTNHNLIKKTAPNGESSTFIYNDENLLITQTSPKGNSVTYEYDRFSRVSKVSYPNSTSTSYIYDEIGRVTKQIDQLGNEVKFVYDNADRVVEIINALGNSATFTYDQRGNRLTATDAQKNVSTYTYDANNNLLTQSNPLGAVTTFAYDGEDRVIKVTDANQNSVSFEYDAMGRVVKSTDAMNNSSSVEYDALGNVKKSYDAMGNMVAELFYNNTNNLIKAVDALNQSTQTSYNLMGQPETITDAKNRVSSFNYDKAGRLVEAIDTMNGKSTQSYDADGNRVDFSDPKANKTSYTYNSMGLPTSITTASGSTTAFAYNDKNQLIESTNAREQKSNISYRDDGSIKSITDEVGTIEYSYDKNGNVLTISENGKTIVMTYSVINQLLSYTDGEGNKIAYAYDKVGNLVTLTYPNAKVVTYSYNANSQLSSVTDNGKTTAYEYDKNSRVVKITRANGTILTRTYNNANQLTSQKDVTPLGVIISEFSFEYDEVGNIIEETNSNEISPKELANLQMTYKAGNLLDEANSTKTIFDADDNMLELGDLKLTYDSRNRLVLANSVAYSYDVLNQKIAKTKEGATSKYVVNPNAPLSQLLIMSDTQTTTYTYGLGLISQTLDSKTLYYHYDLRGSTIALTNENGEIVDRFSYLPYGELYKHSLGTTVTPFLYNGRDGVMNEENNLYYMRARFYSTEVKRFVNRDVLIGGITNFGSLNRFGYVNGRPIIGIDPQGKWINFVFAGAVAIIERQALKKAGTFIATNLGIGLATNYIYDKLKGNQPSATQSSATQNFNHSSNSNNVFNDTDDVFNNSGDVFNDTDDVNINNNINNSTQNRTINNNYDSSVNNITNNNNGNNYNNTSNCLFNCKTTIIINECDK